MCIFLEKLPAALLVRTTVINAYTLRSLRPIPLHQVFVCRQEQELLLVHSTGNVVKNRFVPLKEAWLPQQSLVIVNPGLQADSCPVLVGAVLRTTGEYLAFVSRGRPTQAAGSWRKLGVDLKHL